MDANVDPSLEVSLVQNLNLLSVDHLRRYFTHRRSVAERGGCFQRRLFVCLSVCLFVIMITSERLNVGQ